MLNRTIQIKMVKTPKEFEEAIEENSTAIGDALYLVNETAKSLGKGLILLTATYVALDTLRIVIDNRTRK